MVASTAPPPPSAPSSEIEAADVAHAAPITPPPPARASAEAAASSPRAKFGRAARSASARPLFGVGAPEADEGDTSDEEQFLSSRRTSLKARSAELTLEAARLSQSASEDELAAIVVEEIELVDDEEEPLELEAPNVVEPTTDGVAAHCPAVEACVEPVEAVDAAVEAEAATSTVFGSVFGSVDLLGLLSRHLELSAALMLSCTCRGLLSSLRSDVAPWAAHAAQLGITRGAYTCGPSAMEDAAALVRRMRDAWSVRPGDCLEVRDTYGLFGAARVVVRLDELLLVHFEGYSARWLMWVHRRHDAERLRPLGRDCPLVGSAGATTYTKWEKLLAFVRARLAAGESVWALPDKPFGRRVDCPAAYTFEAASRAMPSTPVVRLALEAEQVAAIDCAPHREWKSVEEYARDRKRCGRVHRAVNVV